MARGFRATSMRTDDLDRDSPAGRSPLDPWTPIMPHTPDAPAPTRGRGVGEGGRPKLWADIDHGSIMGAELVVGILVWGGIGFLLDRWLGTNPWLLLIGTFVGFGGGLYLIWVRSARMERADREARAARTAASTTGDREPGGDGGR